MSCRRCPRQPYFRPGRTSGECMDDAPSAGLLGALNGPAPPDYVFYSPAICHDGGYDAPCSTIANSDRFLLRQIPAIMATLWYRAGGTIILTWDEGSQNDTSDRYGDQGGHVLTVVISAGTKNARPYSGYVDRPGYCERSSTPMGSATWAPPSSPAPAVCRYQSLERAGCRRPGHARRSGRQFLLAGTGSGGMWCSVSRPQNWTTANQARPAAVIMTATKKFSRRPRR